MAAAAVAVLIAVSVRRGQNIQDVFLRREIMVWSVMAGVMLFMLFSVSAPVWDVIRKVLSVAATPWRVQCLLSMALIYLFTVGSAGFRFRNGDYILLWLLLVMLAFFLTTSTSDDPVIGDLKKARIMGIARYNQTRWTDPRQNTMDALLAESRKADMADRVEVIIGKGVATIRQWNDEGIGIDADLSQPGILVIRQFYFPLWHARIDGAESMLEPQEKTGRMLLSVPAGHHQVRLYTSVTETMPRLYRLAQAVSLFAALIFLAGYGRRYLHCRSTLTTGA